MARARGGAGPHRVVQFAAPGQYGGYTGGHRMAGAARANGHPRQAHPVRRSVHEGDVSLLWT
jgi:hypothetical protein